MQIGSDAAQRFATHFSDDVVRSLIAERRVDVASGLFAGLAPLLSREQLEAALGNRQVGASRLRVFVGRRQLDLETLRVIDGQDVNLKVLEQLIVQGATLVFNRLERRFEALHALAAQLAERFAVPIQVTAVLSFGDRSGLSPHHDPENLFVIQLEGSKQWQLLGQPAEPGLPVKAFKAEDRPVREITLHAGDVMFVPAGQPHVCTASPDDSLHLSVLLEPSNGAVAGKALAAAIAQDPPMLVPFLPFLGEESRVQAVAGYRARLHQLVDQLDLDSLLETPAQGGGSAGFAFPDRRPGP